MLCFRYTQSPLAGVNIILQLKCATLRPPPAKMQIRFLVHDLKQAGALASVESHDYPDIVGA